MSDRKVYSYDDIYLLFKEHAEIIDSKFNELNKDKNIIHPTEKDYEQFLKDILDKSTNIVRCLGIYMRGKNKNQRCQAAPHEGSKYCLQHKTQDPEFLEAIKLLRKSKLED